MPVSRMLRNALYLVVGLLLGCIATLSHAQTPGTGFNWSACESGSAGLCAYQPSAEAAGAHAATHHGRTLSSMQNPNQTCQIPWGTNACARLSGGMDQGLWKRTTCHSSYTMVGGNCVAKCTTKDTDIAESSMSDAYAAGSPNLPSSACVNGCRAYLFSFAAKPAECKIVGGVKTCKHKFAYMRSGSGASDVCTAGQGGVDAPAPSQPAPQESCGAGQGMIKMDGVTKCVSTTTGKETNTAPPTTETKTDNQTTTQNPNGTTTVTRTTTNTTTGGTTTVTEVYGAGVTPGSGIPPISTTTGTTGGGAGGVGGTGSGTGADSDDGEDSDFCEKNPDSIACKNIEPGTGAATTGLYTPETGKSFSGSLQTFQNTVTNAPFYSAVSGFFQVNVAGGSCSGLSTTFAVPFGGTMTVDATPILCSTTADLVYSILAIGLAIGASYVAFRWAFY